MDQAGPSNIGQRRARPAELENNDPAAPRHAPRNRPDAQAADIEPPRLPPASKDLLDRASKALAVAGVDHKTLPTTLLIASHCSCMCMQCGRYTCKLSCAFRP